MGRPRIYADAAERQRAYRRRKAEQRSDEWLRLLGLHPSPAVMDAKAYGMIGNAVKRGAVKGISPG